MLFARAAADFFAVTFFASVTLLFSVKRVLLLTTELVDAMQHI